ncbi:MAG: thymidine phosphorylase, partial [Candidatus Brocadiales bacterium]|nr:thymidine phosphorylase [Candidatus Brocadiales bacterium]
QELHQEEVVYLVKGYTQGEIPDYQMAAFLMAIYFKGMSRQETVWLIEEMMRSGEVVDLSSIPGKKVDKHSTGGVGDKVSLILAPLVSCLGVKVPMVSGRALGHTGGTLDKLESIPGFRTQLSIEEFRKNVKEIGLAMAGQTGNFVPADGKLYALRDVTATVESIPLITASILSKKFAEGIDALVLDVKTGSGAFMKGLDESLTLTQNMVDIARAMGKPTVAVITDMNQPLGRRVGNALEVLESIETLQGKGTSDLLELTLELGYQMLRLAGLCAEREEARRRLLEAIRDGRAFRKFQEMVERQGGEVSSLQRFGDYISDKVREVSSPLSGYVHRMDTHRLGLAAIVLGAGRKKLGDKIDPSVGFEVLVKLGDRVERDQPLVKVFYKEESSLLEAEKLILGAYSISADRPPLPPLIYRVIGWDRV